MLPLEGVVAELNRIKASGLVEDYALGGAVAASAYVDIASTEDVDVFVVLSGAEVSLAPLGRVWAELVAKGAKQVGGYLEIAGWPVQLLPPMGPLYTEAIATAVEKRFGQQVARLMDPLHLAAIALATGRGKDYLRVEEFLKRGVVKRAELEAIVDRFALNERWNSFRIKFLNEQ